MRFQKPFQRAGMVETRRKPGSVWVAEGKANRILSSRTVLPALKARDVLASHKGIPLG